MAQYKLFDAEYKFICIVWENEPLNSTELSKLCLNQLGWKKSTTYNMLKKLCKRNLLSNHEATVSSLVKHGQVQHYESEALMEKSFEGSLPQFLTAFFDNRKITEEEATTLKRIIDEATK